MPLKKKKVTIYEYIQAPKHLINGLEGDEQ